MAPITRRSRPRRSASPSRPQATPTCRARGSWVCGSTSDGCRGDACVAPTNVPTTNRGYMKRGLAASSAMLLALLAPLRAAEPTKAFELEQATIDGIQSAILKGELTSTEVVKRYLARIKAYDGHCVSQPDGILGPFTTIKNAGQINSLITVNLRPAARAEYGFGARKGRSLTDTADNSPAMPDALEVAAKQDAHFKATGKLVGPLHGITFAIK